MENRNREETEKSGNSWFPVPTGIQNTDQIFSISNEITGDFPLSDTQLLAFLIIGANFRLPKIIN